MARLENTFSWSRSRDAMHRDCPKRYWLNYYGSWGGWEWAADARTRHIYILKQLKTRWMWAGEVVHNAIEGALKAMRAGEAVDPAEVERRAIVRMREDYLRSLRRDFLQRPKLGALFEHYYEEPLEDTAWVAVRDHVSACVRAFFSSVFPGELRGMPDEAWLSIEDVSTFDFEGTNVWVVPDLAYRRADGTVCIVDWKTGRSSSGPDPVQLACYALFATERWDAKPEDVLTIEYNLHRGEAHEARVDPARLEDVRTAMRESIAAMRALLADPAANVALEGAFPGVSDPATCARCNYKQECHGDGWRALRDGSPPISALT